MGTFRHGFVVLAVCLWASAAPSAHHDHCCWHHGHQLAASQQGIQLYDTSTEVTVTGTIEMVQDITTPTRTGCRSLGGTHLTLKMDAGNLEVHLGPTAYLQKQQITLAKGEEIQVLGSRVVIDGEPVLVARQIKKGDSTWSLRDSAGRPMWSGGRGTM